MPTKLLHKLIADYPDITFKPGRSFKWSARHRTLIYNLSLKGASPLLLHELAHGLLRHDDFYFDVELVRKERLAWDYAQTTLAPRYNITITDDDIEDAMDSYRTWLHKRSVCPECNTSSLQTKTGTYKCLACECQWRASDARERELRRYVLKKT
jgi:hypothetical protein